MTTLAAQLYAAEVARHEVYRDLADDATADAEPTPVDLAALLAEAAAERAAPADEDDLPL